ncbi:hypothetical protein [Halolamina sp.]|jgi:predicted RNA-binding Zn-ribbon protein involved in translation (DUF1610 family)|uniref:hypothetical protein n=1 Tax=Halolamina sp. TaxID=1940283 RepID=UPI0035672598
MGSEKRCPDCGVPLEALKLRTGDGFTLQIHTNEPRPGLLGGLGMKETLTPTAHVCPECGLTRLYVEEDD